MNELAQLKDDGRAMHAPIQHACSHATEVVSWLPFAHFYFLNALLLSCHNFYSG